MIARLLLAAVATAVLVWTGLLLYGERVGSAAVDRLFSANLSSADFDRELARLRRAERLSPDRRWDVLRGAYLITRGRKSEAVATVEGVVRDEPSNMDAWVVIRAASAGTDPARVADATAAIRRINPLSSAPERRRP